MFFENYLLSKFMKILYLALFFSQFVQKNLARKIFTRHRPQNSKKTCQKRKKSV